MSNKLTASVIKQGRWFMARALKLGVVSWSQTIEPVISDLKEAVQLYLEDSPRSRQETSTTVPLFLALGAV